MKLYTLLFVQFFLSTYIAKSYYCLSVYTDYSDASYTCASNLTPKFKLCPYATLKNPSVFITQSHGAAYEVHCC